MEPSGVPKESTGAPIPMLRPTGVTMEPIGVLIPMLRPTGVPMDPTGAIPVLQLAAEATSPGPHAVPHSAAPMRIFLLFLLLLLLLLLPEHLSEGRILQLQQGCGAQSL